MDHTAAAKRPGNVLIDVTFPAPTKVARIWYPVSLAPLFQSCFARAHTQAFAYTHLTTQCVAYYYTQLHVLAQLHAYAAEPTAPL